MKVRFATLLAFLFVWAAMASADTLELKNGSVIKGTYLGGTEREINFRVGSRIQHFAVDDVSSVTFDMPVSETAPPPEPEYQRPPLPAPPPPRDDAASQEGFGNRTGDADRDRRDDARRDDDRRDDARRDDDQRAGNRPEGNRPIDADGTPAQLNVPNNNGAPGYPQAVTVPSGTRITVRTIELIDSSKSEVGDRFSTTLDQPIYVGDVLVAPRGVSVYGRLEEVKTSGQFAGRAQLRMALTTIDLQGRSFPLVTGDYQVSGRSRGANTAAKVGTGAVVGAIIGGVVGGGKGAAVGAGVGAGAGTAVQVMTRGDRVRVPSETLLEFTLEQPLTVTPVQPR